MEAQSALLRVFEEELQGDCGIPLSWYDVLVHLWEAPSETLRMSELADALVLSRSWLTRRVEQMEAAGLVHRCPASTDGRGVCATLTPQGKRMFRKAARSHVRSVDRHFLSLLDEREAQTILACFDRVLAAMSTADHLEWSAGPKA